MPPASSASCRRRKCVFRDIERRTNVGWPKVIDKWQRHQEIKNNQKRDFYFERKTYFWCQATLLSLNGFVELVRWAWLCPSTTSVTVKPSHRYLWPRCCYGRMLATAAGMSLKWHLATGKRLYLDDLHQLLQSALNQVIQWMRAASFATAAETG